MKTKILTTVAALCCAIVLHAQEDRPYQSFFGKEYTQWNGFTGNIDRPLELNHKLQSAHDTVIDGKTYKKFEHFSTPTLYMERSPENDLLLREDTLTGKFWCRYLDGDEEFLIADMSLKLGDTIYLRDYGSCDYRDIDYHYTATCVVEDTMTRDGRRVILLSTLNFGYPLYFIEGIGCTNLFGYMRCEGSWGPDVTDLVCCQKDDELVYHHIEDWMIEEGDCKIDYIGIDEARAERVSVYPNPCGDWITLDGERAQSVSLYDMTGRKLDVDIKADGRIHMGNLPSGVYLLRAVLENSTITRTIIKQ